MTEVHINKIRGNFKNPYVTYSSKLEFFVSESPNEKTKTVSLPMVTNKRN